MIEFLYRDKIFCYEGCVGVKGGMVATFVDNREIGICSDKTRPVGFFIQEHESQTNNGTICVLVGQAEFRTDIFEKNTYKINDFLYCSRRGRITNELKYRGNIIIGIVNYVTKDHIGLVTCMARGLEN